MTKLPKWHRKAPATPVKVPNTPKPWRAGVDRFDPWSQNDDGTAIPRDFRCVEAPDAGLRRILAIWPQGAAAPIVEGIQADGSVIEVKTRRVVPPKKPPVIPRPNVGKALDPAKCIAAGGRKRCMDCRCGLPSPKNVVAETWETSGYSGYKPGSPSAHGRANVKTVSNPRSSGLLDMIDRKRDLMRGPQMIDDEDTQALWERDKD